MTSDCYKGYYYSIFKDSKGYSASIEAGNKYNIITFDQDLITTEHKTHLICFQSSNKDKIMQAIFAKINLLPLKDNKA